MKKILLFILLYILMMCRNNQKKDEILEGRWQIIKFYHKSENISKGRNLIIQFDNDSDFWITNIVDGENKLVSSKFKIHKDSTSLKVDVKNSEDVRLNGNYDLYIDTIINNQEKYVIKFTLDNENTYMEAIKSKLKYATPPASVEKR